jgi:hypothetical protein
MWDMKAAAVLLSLFVAATLLAVIGSASRGPTSTSAPLPITTVVQHGGLCYRGTGLAGTECRSTVTITDRWISAPGARRRALKKTERAHLLSAIGQINADYLRTHPFRGLCPTGVDGLESIYRFRGFGRQLASCTYDLSGVRAVTLVNRLISQLGARRWGPTTTAGGGQIVRTTAPPGAADPARRLAGQHAGCPLAA